MTLPASLNQTEQISNPDTAKRIDLWFVEPGTITSVALLNAYRNLLSDDEQARCARLHFAGHRHEYLITRALVRTVLSQLVTLPARTLRFADNAYGRPSLIQWPELSFNVSHTDGMIALAVAENGQIGIDIERLGTRRSTQNLAQHCFTRREVIALQAIDPSRFDTTFFSYWTLKESYVKACGLGLSLPLDSFEFDLTRTPSIGFLPPEDRPSDKSMRFWLLKPGVDHLSALCALCPHHVPLLNARRVVPLVSEKSMDVATLLLSPTPVL